MKRIVCLCLAALIALFGVMQSASANETVTYAYDALGRLVAVSSSGTVNNGQSVTTTFDPAGNRTNYTVGGVAADASLAIADATVTEGGTLAFTVTRSGNTAITASASYATASGTATSGSDFTAASGTVSFAAGQTTATISVATIDDTAVEATETMTVTLSSPAAGTTIATATGTGTIIDNDVAGGGSNIIIPQSYSASSARPGYSYTGLAGTGAGMRDGVYNAANSVHGTDGEASPWIMMDLGSVKQVGSIVVAPVPATFDGLGAFYLNGAVLERSNDGTAWTTVGTVSGAVDGAQMGLAVGTSTRYLRLRRAYSYLAVGDFYASTGPVVASLSIADTGVTEGGTLAFTVTRGGNTDLAASASYATASGTALSGIDFTQTSGTVSFAAGQTTATINVATIDDTAVEPIEAMTVTLSAPSANTIITAATGTGTIYDNDGSGGGGGGGTIITPQSYSASSTRPGYSYTGLSGTGAGMRDSVYNTASSVHCTDGEVNPWVMMDLGSVQQVGSVRVAPIPATFDSMGAFYLNNAVLERSNDGSTWTTVATVAGTTDGNQTTIAVGAATRFLRLRRAYSFMAVGDFYATAP